MISSRQATHLHAHHPLVPARDDLLGRGIEREGEGLTGPRGLDLLLRGVGGQHVLDGDHSHRAWPSHRCRRSDPSSPGWVGSGPGRNRDGRLLPRRPRRRAGPGHGTVWWEGSSSGPSTPVVVVGVLVDELLQPASPMTEAAVSTTSDQVRTRDMNEGSFQEQTQGKPDGWPCRSDGSAWPVTAGARGLVPPPPTTDAELAARRSGVRPRSTLPSIPETPPWHHDLP